MKPLGYYEFLRTLPNLIRPGLPGEWQSFRVHQPYQWLLQLHFGEPALHYEIGRVAHRPELELGLHFEAKEAHLNRYLLLGFRRHFFEIRDELGERIEAEMWDKGWSKVYELYPAGELTEEYQAAVSQRFVQIMLVLHPVFLKLRQEVSRIY